MVEYSLVGRKYKDNSYDGKSFDCYSLIWYIYKCYGINIPKRMSNYSLRVIAKKMKQDEGVLWIPIDWKDRRHLDLLFFNTTLHLKTHVGMVIDKIKFIHTTQETNVIIAKNKKSIHLAQLYKVYRWHELV